MARSRIPSRIILLLESIAATVTIFFFLAYMALCLWVVVTLLSW